MWWHWRTQHMSNTIFILIVVAVSLLQISSWSSTPPALCWPSLMAALLLQSWTWEPATAVLATSLAAPFSSPPTPVFLWRLSCPQSCWTVAWSHTSRPAAPWSAWSLWQRQKPARKHSFTCANWVRLDRKSTPASWTDCELEGVLVGHWCHSYWRWFTTDCIPPSSSESWHWLVNIPSPLACVCWEEGTNLKRSTRLVEVECTFLHLRLLHWITGMSHVFIK